MNIKFILIEAIKEKKTSIILTKKLTDIMVDTFLRISIRDSGTPNVKYSYKKLEDGSFQIDLTYEENKPLKIIEKVEKEKPRPKTYFKPLSEIEKKISKKLYKEVRLRDEGDESFIDQIDLLEARIFNIYTPDWEATVDKIDKRHAYITAKAEGAIAISYNTHEMNDDDTFKVRFEFLLGTDYKTFLTNLYEGHKKAKEIYQEITGGLTLAPEFLCLHALAYLEEHCVYNHDYSKVLDKGDANIFGEDQKIENAMAYGSLVLNKAICEGFAWGFMRIVEAGGLEISIGSGKRDGVGHEWAKVKIDDEWYNVEVTLSSYEGIFPLTCFLVSDEYMEKKGYEINKFTAPCTSHRYEGENLSNLLDRYIEALPGLVEQGLDKKYLDFNYLMYDLAKEAE